MTSTETIGFPREHACFGCGSGNVHGLRLEFQGDSETGGVQTRFIPERRFEGYDGMIHGGIIATILDEVMAWSLHGLGAWGVTADMTIRFRRPMEVGIPIIARGHIVRDRGRLLDVRGTIAAERQGTILAEAKATFMRVTEGQARAWRERYIGENGD